MPTVTFTGRGVGNGTSEISRRGNATREATLTSLWDNNDASLHGLYFITVQSIDAANEIVRDIEVVCINREEGERKASVAFVDEAALDFALTGHRLEIDVDDVLTKRIANLAEMGVPASAERWCNALANVLGEASLKLARRAITRAREGTAPPSTHCDQVRLATGTAWALVTQEIPVPGCPKVGVALKLDVNAGGGAGPDLATGTVRQIQWAQTYATKSVSTREGRGDLAQLYCNIHALPHCSGPSIGVAAYLAEASFLLSKKFPRYSSRCGLPSGLVVTGEVFEGLNDPNNWREAPVQPVNDIREKLTAALEVPGCTTIVFPAANMNDVSKAIDDHRKEQTVPDRRPNSGEEISFFPGASGEGRSRYGSVTIILAENVGQLYDLFIRPIEAEIESALRLRAALAALAAILTIAMLIWIVPPTPSIALVRPQANHSIGPSGLDVALNVTGTNWILGHLGDTHVEWALGRDGQTVATSTASFPGSRHTLRIPPSALTQAGPYSLMVKSGSASDAVDFCLVRSTSSIDLVRPQHYHSIGQDGLDVLLNVIGTSWVLSDSGESHVDWTLRRNGQTVATSAASFRGSGHAFHIPPSELKQDGPYSLTVKSGSASDTEDFWIVNFKRVNGLPVPMLETNTTWVEGSGNGVEMEQLAEEISRNCGARGNVCLTEVIDVGKGRCRTFETEILSARLDEGLKGLLGNRLVKVQPYAVELTGGVSTGPNLEQVLTVEVSRQGMNSTSVASVVQSRPPPWLVNWTWDIDERFIVPVGWQAPANTPLLQAIRSFAPANVAQASGARVHLTIQHDVSETPLQRFGSSATDTVRFDFELTIDRWRGWRGPTVVTVSVPAIPNETLPDVKGIPLPQGLDASLKNYFSEERCTALQHHALEGALPRILDSMREASDDWVVVLQGPTPTAWASIQSDLSTLKGVQRLGGKPPGRGADEGLFLPDIGERGLAEVRAVLQRNSFFCKVSELGYQEFAMGASTPSPTILGQDMAEVVGVDNWGGPVLFPLPKGSSPFLFRRVTPPGHLCDQNQVRLDSKKKVVQGAFYLEFDLNKDFVVVRPPSTVSTVQKSTSVTLRPWQILHGAGPLDLPGMFGD